MPSEYRLYFIDENEHVRGAVDMAPTAEELKLPPAKELVSAVALELWKTDNFVCRFERISL